MNISIPCEGFMNWFLVVMTLVMSVAVPSTVLADEQVRVYPLKAVFVGERALENEPFKKALSSDQKGADRAYAIEQFATVFKQYFPEAVSIISDANKYSTFTVFLQIPRVSQYKINKSATLVDLYLPMTMTISFANMGTGEILYTSTYTYYAKREATVASLEDERITSELYREIYNLLLGKVIQSARQSFHPFSVTTTIVKEWHGLYLLDKGDRHGFVKGDTLLGPQGLPLTIIYASDTYAVAQPIMGKPETGMAFQKYTNGNLDELKKPKVMLLPGAKIDTTAYIPEQTIYQLLSNALGKNAAFTLTPVDKGFYDAQKTVIQETGLSQRVTQQRELPDYFLRVQFMGPTSVTVPTNKGDVLHDEHSVRACGDLLDRSGRVLYGTCVYEKITDEVVAGIRFAHEDRQEVVVKNAIVKLADELIKSVKFKNFELPVAAVSGDIVAITDKAGVLSVGGNATVFKSIGMTGGNSATLWVPSWQLAVAERNGDTVETQRIGALALDLSSPELADKVLVEGMLTSADSQLKRLSVCNNTTNVPQGLLEKSIYYALVQGLHYPFYDTTGFAKALQPLRSAAYGFKAEAAIQKDPAETELCVEPVVKVSLDASIDNAGYSQLNYGLLTGLRVVDRAGSVVWKKGLKQAVKIIRPAGASDEYVEQELAASVSLLVDTLAKSVKINVK